MFYWAAWLIEVPNPTYDYTYKLICDQGHQGFDD